MMPPDARKLVALVEASPEAVALAQASIAPVLIGNGANPERFSQSPRVQINVGSEPAAILFFQTVGKKFRVEYLQSISTAEKLPWRSFANALDRLALQHGCNLLEGRTRRPGIVKSLEPFGWFPESINLQKKL